MLVVTGVEATQLREYDFSLLRDAGSRLPLNIARAYLLLPQRFSLSSPAAEILGTSALLPFEAARIRVVADPGLRPLAGHLKQGLVR